MTAKARIAKPGKSGSRDEQQELVEMPGHLIRRCHQIAVAIFLEETAPFEITPQQYAALAALAANDGVDQITLAGYAALNRTTAGEVVGRMEAAGLLTRRESEVDRRVKNLHITKAGRKRLADVEAAVQRVQQRLLKPLAPGERQQFVASLSRIARENNELSRAPLRGRPDADG